LSEIVARPDLARPVEGARDAIAGLTQRYRTVAIVTGRRPEEVAALLEVPHVMYVGLYGFEEETPELLTAVVPLVETAAARVPDAWIEDKGARSRSTTGRRPIPTPREPR
jgi:trehalose-6-phosphatase